jgi:RimJ/RimL family protein N-acetyltransferase
MRNGQIVVCPDEIEGLRVSLKPVTDAHAKEIFQQFTPAITAYMFPRSPSDIGDVERFITESSSQRKNGTDLIFAILDKQTNEFLGVCGLHGTKNPREPELGVWLKKNMHGKGLGREAISVLRGWSERVLSVDGFIYPVDRRNLPSRKIPEALGGVVAGERRVQNMSGIELDELIYRIPVAVDHL